jgi:hypothetical protein
MRDYKVQIWINRVMEVDFRREDQEWDEFQIIIIGIRGWDDR